MIQIDRQKIYESHGYKFKNFVCLTDEDKMMILNWRNHENIRKEMVNKELISVENHFRFFESLKNRSDCYYWLVTDNEGTRLGVLDLVHIKETADVGEIGFYLNQEELGRGFDFMLESLFFVFGVLRLGNNLVTVDVNNEEVVLFNKYIGTKFDGIKEIDGNRFYYCDRMTGEHLLKHYEDFSLLDYARFVRKNKRNI